MYVCSVCALCMYCYVCVYVYKAFYMAHFSQQDDHSVVTVPVKSQCDSPNLVHSFSQPISMSLNGPFSNLVTVPVNQT